MRINSLHTECRMAFTRAHGWWCVDGFLLGLDDKEVSLDGVSLGLDDIEGSLDSSSLGLDHKEGSLNGFSLGLDNKEFSLDGISLGLDDKEGLLNCFSLGLDNEKGPLDGLALGTLDRDGFFDCFEVKVADGVTFEGSPNTCSISTASFSPCETVCSPSVSFFSCFHFWTFLSAAFRVKFEFIADDIFCDSVEKDAPLSKRRDFQNWLHSSWHDLPF
jgi:hypothetical protein